MTPLQAAIILEVHEIYDVLQDEEETNLLAKHHPGVLEAYKALQRIADGDLPEDGGMAPY